MPRRPPVLLACLLGALLGLAVGLAGLERLLEYPVGRFAELFPRPAGTLWIRDLQGLAGMLPSLSLPLRAAVIALLLLALATLASLLNPAFHLLKPPNDNPGQGFGAHLDTRLLLRAAGGVLLTFWLAGVLGPLALLLPRGPLGVAAFFLLGGLPLWTSILPMIAGLLALTLLLGVSLWLIWGPGGTVTGKGEPSRKVTALWGLLAGAAALPALVALQASKLWLPDVAPAFTLADRAGWLALLAAALVAPAAAGAWVMWAAWRFHPRTPDSGGLRHAAALSLGLMLAGVAELALIQGFFSGVDAGRRSLVRVVGLKASGLSRFALLLTPDGRAIPSATQDGTDNGFGRDRIECNTGTVRVVQEFLDRRRHRSLLTFRAFRHLYGCAALDWNTTAALEADLQMLERAPSPLAAARLLERLGQCPTTPENRRVLDALADPTRFEWQQPRGRRWLGAAYVRFGDMNRAREFLLDAGLNREEFEQLMGGLSPLPDGVVRGKVTIRGEAIKGVRIGLIRAEEEFWKPMGGFVNPDEWGRVAASTLTDAQGRFELRQIPEGRYILAVTGGGIGRHPGQATTTPAPGVLELDRLRPQIEVPAFNIEWREPLVIPDDGSPGIRA